MSGAETFTDVSTEQVHQAICDFLMPSDKAFLDGMEASRARTGKRHKLVALLPEISDAEKDDEATPRASRAESFAAPKRLNEPVLTAH
jgi:hypothetical protein